MKPLPVPRTPAIKTFCLPQVDGIFDLKVRRPHFLGLPLNSRPMAGSPKVALVIAHPGHELRVYGWLERERPEVGRTG